MVSGASAMRVELLTEFAIPFDTLTPIVDTVKFPTELSVQQLGGLDFFGFSMNIRGWKLGIGFQDGDYIGLDFSASSTPNADYAFDYEYTLTHTDITEIPEGDSIPVNISLEAEGDLSFIAEGAGGFRTRSLVFAAAHTLFGLDVGFGFQMTPVSIVGNFSSLFNGRVHSGGSVSVEAVQDWTIDASFEVEIDADSILECQGDAQVDFYLSSLYYGLKKEWRSVSLGICGEFNFPTFISGDWELIASIPTQFPKIRFEDDNLVVDTVNKVISGHAKLVVYDFEKDDSVYQSTLDKPFIGSGGVTAGIDVRLWRLEAGLFGGINATSNWNYCKIRAGANIGFRTFIPLRAGVIFHLQYFDIGGVPVSALPVISFGCGTDFNIKKLNIILALTGNTTHEASPLTISGFMVSEKKRSALFALGLGMRYNF
jgi:hypothetical protein